LQCPACDGKGGDCSRCGGAGELTFTSCPRPSIPAQAYAAVRYEEMSRRGLLPVAGGLLDQTACGLDAIQVVADDARAWRARLGIREDPW
jgi:hypothetical protein